MPPATSQITQKIRFARSDDGVRLAWASTGSGFPIIKAATWLSHLEYDWESPVWRHLLESMARTHRFVRYDERGCGLSDWDVPRNDFESWVTDLETVVDIVAAPKVALLGISQGAAIAVAYAARHPERVSHLVLSSGYGRGRLVRSQTDAQREEAEMMCRLAELGWGKQDASFRQFFTSQFIPGGTAEQHQWFNELERLSTSPANAAQFMRVFNEIDVMTLLPQVRCPTLVLHSRQDVRVPFEEGRLLATGIPDARLVPIDSPNHLLLGSEPGWQRWVDEVMAFLPTDEQRQADNSLVASLTRRQVELLDLLAQGRDNAQIAAAMGLSEKTVRNHITGIFDRLDVETRSQAIVLARESGFGQTRQ